MQNGFFHSWKESLIIFAPQNLKLFSMAALNALIKALKPFFIYFAPFLVLWLGYDWVSRMPTLGLIFRNYYPIYYVAFFTFALMNAGMVASIRPSTQLKKCTYF